MPHNYIKRILDARIYDVAVETPLSYAPALSLRLNNHVLLKREDLQPIFSFKIRGAYNKLLQLSDSERARGVITASAGNHAQGLALAAKKQGVKAVIVMPLTTPQIKVDAVRAHGAEIVLTGDTYDEASDYANIYGAEHNLIYVHPYDDPDVIAGQGTVAMEILRQHTGSIDGIFIPVGGGGLCAGMAAYIKYVRPEIKIFAVEPEDAACLQAAMVAGHRVTLPEVGLFADGVAVAKIGEEPYRILKDTVDDVITATTDEMCAAIKDIFEETRSIAEPAGALALAGLKKYVAKHHCKQQTFIAIHSGANTNFDRLRYISERTETGEKREAILAVTIPEQPGSFKRFCSKLGKHNITEFNYRCKENAVAHIFVGIQIAPNEDDRRRLIDKLTDDGYEVVDMTDNETAKLHIRHMVGGCASHIDNEVVYRFEFPERPGALDNFLKQLGGRWNISMFHYRNHGAAYGRVLVGMQVPSEQHHQLLEFLEHLNYRYCNETENQAYKLFLSY
jgi:threonine dehydratase